MCDMMPPTDQPRITTSHPGPTPDANQGSETGLHISTAVLEGGCVFYGSSSVSDNL